MSVCVCVCLCAFCVCVSVCFLCLCVCVCAVCVLCVCCDSQVPAPIPKQTNKPGSKSVVIPHPPTHPHKPNKSIIREFAPSSNGYAKLPNERWVDVEDGKQQQQQGPSGGNGTGGGGGSDLDAPPPLTFGQLLKILKVRGGVRNPQGFPFFFLPVEKDTRMYVYVNVGNMVFMSYQKNLTKKNTRVYVYVLK